MKQEQPLELKRGTQIIYIPTHANGDKHHPDVEYGFVTSILGDCAFCRYWSRHHGGLRTVANSELTPVANLVPWNRQNQAVIDSWLEMDHRNTQERS